MRTLLLIFFSILLAQVCFIEGAGKKKRTNLELCLTDLISPQVVQAAILSQRPPEENPLPPPGKGPFVPEFPVDLAVASPTTTLNQALSAATGNLIDTGAFDSIYNYQGFNLLYKPSSSLCYNYPSSPDGQLAAILATRTLRVGWFEAFPHSYYSQGTGPFGVDVEFVKQVGADISRHYHVPLNVTFVHITTSPTTFFGDVATGLGSKYDVAIGLTNLPSRALGVNFACPYNTADYFVARGTRDPQYRLKTMADLNNPIVTIGTLPRGTNTGDEARRLFPLATFLDGLNSSDDVINSLKYNQTHVAFDVGVYLREYMRQNPLSGFSPIYLPPGFYSTPPSFALASAKL